MSNLNQRCEKILSILMHESGYVSLKRLSEKTGVSKRSIYYDICKINEWLEEHEIRELEPERGKGIFACKTGDLQCHSQLPTRLYRAVNGSVSCQPQYGIRGYPRGYPAAA